MIRNKANLMLSQIDISMNTLNIVEKVSAENILPDVRTRLLLCKNCQSYHISGQHKNISKVKFIP
jgi:hypothetical protein